METLQIMPTLVQRSTRNFGEYAEDATLIVEEQPTREKRPLFIEANTCLLYTSYFIVRIKSEQVRISTGYKVYPNQWEKNLSLIHISQQKWRL